MGLSLDGAGNIYVADAGNAALLQINPAGGYFINKALPSGLSFNSRTGGISGTPTAPSPATDYTVTAYNLGGGSMATVNLNVISNKPSLANLTLSSGMLSPVFQSSLTAYTADVSAATTSVTLTPTANPGTTIKVDGKTVVSGTPSQVLSLKTGANNYNIVLTMPGGTTTTYSITVNRKSTDATLAGINIPQGTLLPSFVSTKLAYTLAVDNSANSITLIPTVSYPAATVMVNGNAVPSGKESAEIPLTVGANTFQVVVTAEDGNTKTYSIVVTRAVSNTGASKPAISYGSPKVYAVGTPIASLALVNTGGTVPATIYGQVSTIAGTVAAGSTNGTGSAASFNIPYNLASDASGNIYVADENNNLIRKIDINGVVSTFAGSGAQGSANGTGTAASFKYPHGVATDASGNVFVADAGNYLIRKITSSGEVTTLAGRLSSGSRNGTGASASFDFPANLVTDASGNVYVTDYNNSLIRKITPAGVVTTFAGGGVPGFVDGAADKARFNNPSGIVTDALGNVFVSDVNNHRIRKITAAGTVSTFAGTGTIGSTDGPGNVATFSAPYGLTIDVLGNLYVADAFSHIIREISPSGVVSTLAGGSEKGYADGIGTTATFTTPRGITIGASGALYVSDNNLIRKITLTGYSITPALPAGLVFDATTGTISGTPISAAAATTYIVTAYNAAGSSSTKVTIAVVTNNANLSGLSLSAGELTPVFDAATNSYTASVSSTTDAIKITPTTSDPKAVVKINGTTVNSGTASASIPLAVGLNSVSIVVTAEDGVTTKLYTISVTRTVNSLNSLFLPVEGGRTTPLLTTVGNEKIEANNILSPNGDGVNDLWIVKNIAFHPDNKVTVYNTTGQVVFTKNNYANDWAGTYNGAVLKEGTYYYSIKLPNENPISGFITVIQNK